MNAFTSFLRLWKGKDRGVDLYASACQYGCMSVNLQFCSEALGALFAQSLSCKEGEEDCFAVFVMHCLVFRFLLGVYHVFVYIFES